MSARTIHIASAHCGACTHQCHQGHDCDGSRRASLTATRRIAPWLVLAVVVLALCGCSGTAADLLVIAADTFTNPTFVCITLVLVLLVGTAAGWCIRGAVERAPFTVLNAESHPDTDIALAQMPGLDHIAARTDALLYGERRRSLSDILRGKRLKPSFDSRRAQPPWPAPSAHPGGSE